MDVTTALDVLAALSQETRLWAFRILVQAGPAGLCAGDVADALGSRQNTMSSHLKLLSACGLVNSRRAGRLVMYSANDDTVKSLLVFLVEDCCGGNAAFRQQIAEAPEVNADLAGVAATERHTQ